MSRFNLLQGTYLKMLNEIKSLAMLNGGDPSNVQMLAVTKGRSTQEILELYELGQRDFGENRVQELLQKAKELPSDARWHFIGRLQSNKISKILPLCHLIHSVDSLELAKNVSKQAEKHGKKISILLQVNTSGESSKQGFSGRILESSFEDVLKLPGLMVKGLMTMAPQTVDEGILRQCFKSLRLVRDALECRYADEKLPILSMGMSGDYPVAIEEGATLVRIGSKLFEISKNSE